MIIKTTTNTDSQVLLDTLNAFITELPPLDDIFPDNAVLEISADINRQGVINIRGRVNIEDERVGTFWRAFREKEGVYTLNNMLLEFTERFQNNGLATIFNRAGIASLEFLGGSVIDLTANIDVGGYVWLRKGFFPESKRTLDAFVEDSKKISAELKSRWLNMTEEQARAFVLTNEFRAYKDVFLETSWDGKADISNPATKAAMTGRHIAVTSKKTANEELRDALIRHQIHLLRYSGYVRNRMNAILQQSEQELVARIQRDLQGMTGVTTSKEWERLQRLQKALTAIRANAWDDANKLLTEEMLSLADAEPATLAATLNTVSPVLFETALPATRLIRAIATSRPFEGRVLKDWANTMKQDDIRRIMNAVQMGMVSGETSEQITKRIVGTSILKGADGVTEISRRQVQAIVRTAIQHVANSARDEFLKENADIFELEQFVATLDSRTTPVCRANDGKRFKVGRGPKPPLHIACRSLRVAAINGSFAGDRPAKPVTEKMLLKEYAEKNKLAPVTTRDELPRGFKTDFDKWARIRARELVGPIPATTTYEPWLRSQSIEFQEEVLGKAKAKLFREGNLPLDRFVDRNGNELTLQQLAVKEREAFEAAGLVPN